MHARRPPARLIDAQKDFHAGHEEVMALVRALREAGDPQGVRALQTRANHLLGAHFSEEESRDGVFDWMVALAPTLEEGVQHLVADHKRLRSLLATFADRQETDLVAAAHELGAALAAHEAAEHALLTRALEA